MSRQLTFKDAINEAVDLEMTRDENVVMMGKTLSAVQALRARKMHGVAYSVLPKGFMRDTQNR